MREGNHCPFLIAATNQGFAGGEIRWTTSLESGAKEKSSSWNGLHLRYFPSFQSDGKNPKKEPGARECTQKTFASHRNDWTEIRKVWFPLSTFEN